MAGRAARVGHVGRRVASIGHLPCGGLLVRFAAPAAHGENLPEALAKAYQTNPQLNAERARQRATDENVPQALAGYRPQIIASLSAGLQAVRNLLPDNTIQSANLKPWTIGVTVTQTLFNGFKTANSVRVAELQVQSGREALRNVGQGVLLDAVTAYTNVLANQSLVDAQRANVAFLQRNPRHHPEASQCRRRHADRHRAGRGAPEPRPRRSERRRGQPRHQPGDLYPGDRQRARAACAPPKPWTAYLPRSRDDATGLAFREHPAVMAASFDVDVASTTIRVAESSLMPTITLQGSASRSRRCRSHAQHLRDRPGLGDRPAARSRSMTAARRPRRPGRPRKSPAQSRLVLDQVRNQARTAAVGAWVANEGAKIAVTASESEVRAATVALQGVQQEAAGGQRTTVDVLNSQQDLILAKARLIGAQRDRVIASYTLLSAIGRLDVKTLGAQHAGLSAGSALPSGARRLARPAHAVGAVGRIFSRC